MIYQGNISYKDRHNKGQNNVRSTIMDLTEAEDIKTRWQEYTKRIIQKKVFMTQIITVWFTHNMVHSDHNGVITHLEPDSLEYEVKWALGSIMTNKANGSDGIPVELFYILKDNCS